MTNLNDKPFALIGVHVGGSTVKQLKANMDKEKLPWRSFVDLGHRGGRVVTPHLAPELTAATIPAFENSPVAQRGRRC